MPLTPLPANNTKRYALVVHTPEHVHHMIARCTTSFSDSTALSNLTAVGAALADGMGNDCHFTSVLVAAQGSNIFNPVAGWSTITGVQAGLPALQEPRSVCISGRASSGRKVKTFVWGLSGVTTPDTYLSEPIVASYLSGFQGLLNSQTDFWLAIDGLKPVWYNRATWGYNDHFVATARK
jgi:hypothetical protein